MAQQYRTIVEGLRGEAATSSLNNIEKLFGRVRPEDRRTMTQNQSISLGDVTDILLRRAHAVVPEQVVGLVTESYISPYTTYLLPIRVLGYNESTLIKWKDVAFQGGIMPIGERRSKGRTFTYNETEHNETIVRRQAAIEIESDFYSTPEGMIRWQQKVHQIATLIVTTEEHDVLITILNAPTNRRIRAQDMNAPTNRVYGDSLEGDIESEMKLRRDMFMIVNKTPDSRGFAALITDMKHQMKAKSNVIADTIIIPPYLKGNYMMKDDNWHASSAGTLTIDNRREATTISKEQLSITDKFMDLNVIDSSLVRAVPDTEGAPTDLLTAPAQIGEYYPMEILATHPDLTNMEGYKSIDRNISIYNEDHSRFATVTFIKALESSFRFDEEGNLSADKHTGLGEDIFTCKNNFPEAHGQGVRRPGEPVGAWFHVDNAYLSTDMLMRVIETMKNNIYGIQAYKTIIDSAAPVGNSTSLKLSKVGALGAILGIRENALTFGVRERRNLFVCEGLTQTERVLGGLFLASACNLTTFKILSKHNVFIPINIILARPWMKYWMSSIVMMKAGKETGETVVGRQTFDMSSNTGNGTLTANYACQTKAIVYNSHNIAVMPRVFCQGYKGGNNVNFINTEDLENQIHVSSGVMNGKSSLMSIVVPADTNLLNERTWIDVRGRSSHDSTDNEKHFPCSEFVDSLYRFEDPRIASPIDDDVDYDQQTCRANTTCWLGHMFYGPDQKMVNINTGHLGSNTYDQVNNNRNKRCFAVTISQQSYNNRGAMC